MKINKVVYFQKGIHTCLRHRHMRHLRDVGSNPKEMNLILILYSMEILLWCHIPQYIGGLTETGERPVHHLVPLAQNIY